jgi:acyl carrier protein
MSSDSENSRTWDAAAIAERVRTIVAAKTNGVVSPQATFDELGLDSLAMAEMVFEIENAFKIRTDERLLDLHSIGQVTDYVAQELKKDRNRH